MKRFGLCGWDCPCTKDLMVNYWLHTLNNPGNRCPGLTCWQTWVGSVQFNKIEITSNFISFQVNHSWHLIDWWKRRRIYIYGLSSVTVWQAKNIRQTYIDVIISFLPHNVVCLRVTICTSETKIGRQILCCVAFIPKDRLNVKRIPHHHCP